MQKQPTWARNKPTSVAVDSRVRFRLVSIDRLHAAMAARGYMSGYQLAKASGVGVSTINHLVHGHRNTASAETVRRLQECLGRGTDDLFMLEKSLVSGDRSTSGRKAA